MNNFFIKKFFPQLGGWIIATIILEFITWSYLPQMANTFLCTLQESPYLSSFVVFIISSLIYAFYVMFRFASEFYRTYCEDIKKIDKSLHDCYLKFVIDDRNIIARRIKCLQSDSGSDLLWETHGLALNNICKKENCGKSSWPFKNYFEFISTRRRERMIRISLSFLNWRTSSCFAVESHLKNIICNPQKFNTDCKYREDQIKKLKKRINPFLEIRRIVIIKEDDWNYLKENHLKDLTQYLQWHVTNNWDVIICVNNDYATPLTLSSICQLGNDAYDDFSDFVIIKKKINKNLVIFAQNSEERALMVYEKTDNNGYFFNWFNNVWEQGGAVDVNHGNNCYHHIDQSFINNKLS